MFDGFISQILQVDCNNQMTLIGVHFLGLSVLMVLAEVTMGKV